MMRMMLYEAAQSMLVRSTKWSWLKAWAMQIARRRGMKKAIVALARRLAVIMHASMDRPRVARKFERNGHFGPR
jgi:transposase